MKYYSGFCYFHVNHRLIHLLVGDLAYALWKHTKPFVRTGVAAHSPSDPREQWNFRSHFQDPSILYSSRFIMLYQYSSIRLPEVETLLLDGYFLLCDNLLQKYAINLKSLNFSLIIILISMS